MCQIPLLFLIRVTVFNWGRFSSTRFYEKTTAVDNYKKTSAFFKPVSSSRLITKTKVTIIIIKNNIIIIIRTFPESFSPKKFSLPNNFINIKRGRMLRHVDVDTNHEIPLMSDLVR